VELLEVVVEFEVEVVVEAVEVRVVVVECIDVEVGMFGSEEFEAGGFSGVVVLPVSVEGVLVGVIVIVVEVVVVRILDDLTVPEVVDVGVAVESEVRSEASRGDTMEVEVGYLQHSPHQSIVQESSR